MLQHALYSVPYRRHGYCIDDNARALILMTQIEDLADDVRDRWTTIYASFIQHAWNEDARRFRNFMNFDRSWCEDAGSEDSRSEEHTSELQSLMRTSYAVFCLKKKKYTQIIKRKT